MAWLFKQAASKYWWIGFRANGKQFRKSTGTSDEALAKKDLAKVEAMIHHQRAGILTEELYRFLTGTTRISISLKLALEEWIAECHSSNSPRTAGRYELTAREFAEHLNASDADPQLDSVNSEQVRSYLTKKWRATSASNANMARKVLSIFFRRAIANEQIKTSPMPAVKKFKASQDDQKTRRGYTLPELKLLQFKAPSEFWRYMILAGFYTGLRMGDLIQLRWDHVDFPSREIRLKPDKTNKPLGIPIRDLLLAFLHRLDASSKHSASDYIWPEQAARYKRAHSGSFSNEFYDKILAPCGLVPPRKTKSASKAGRKTRRQPSEVSFHSLRHSFITFLKVSGSNQAIAKALAGHSSDQVSELYTHIPMGVLNDAIGQLPVIVVNMGAETPAAANIHLPINTQTQTVGGLPSIDQTSEEKLSPPEEPEQA